MRGELKNPRSFRPAPLPLRRLRYRARYREYARFYGSYVSMTGKIKRFSFQVGIGPTLSANGRRLYRLMVTTCNLLLDKMIPEHKLGQIFHNFGDLLKRTRWFKVRKLRNYKAGVEYER